ncbi:MAG: hypothetical protein AAGF31_04015 [Planctomycetota bacterium]
MPWAAYLWPGLPHLWNEGSWAGLTLAVGFTVLLNTLILTTFVWPEWLPERVKLACGVSTALIWLVALLETRGELRRQAVRRNSAENQHEETENPSAQTAEIAADSPATPTSAKHDSQELDTQFGEAQRLYLRGDWVATEQTLVKLLRVDRDDIEAQLLLASVWQATERNGKARRLLTRLARRQDAEAWQYEVARELERLETADSHEDTTTDTDEASTAVAGSLPAAGAVENGNRAA